MEVPGMDEFQKTEDHMTSAAAFVEGGIQEACDDACSICLEAFCESDPSTITSCKHEFHLQCILEWCQRSSNCPMCWQTISLKDPSSQELLEAVERERSFIFNPSRNSAIFHHPTLGDFELQHLPVGTSDMELEERIIQHLAAAAAMGRARRTARREGPRSRSSAHGRPQLVVFSTHPNAHPSGSVSSSVGGESEPAAISVARPSVPLIDRDEPQQHMPNYALVQSGQIFASASGSPSMTARQRISANRHTGLMPNQDRAGPSDFQSFSESLKSRFNAMSMRYKETISKSTRGWRERLFSRNTSMDALSSESGGEVNSGIVDVSRMMERLEARENSRAGAAALTTLPDALAREQQNRGNVENHNETTLNEGNIEAIAAGSVSN